MSAEERPKEEVVGYYHFLELQGIFYFNRVILFYFIGFVASDCQTYMGVQETFDT